MEEQALYVRDGDAYVGTILTQGGWDPNAANGGTVLALLGHCLDEVPTLVPMTLEPVHRRPPAARADRPAPPRRARPCSARARRSSSSSSRVLADDVEHVRATALRLRDDVERRGRAGRHHRRPAGRRAGAARGVAAACAS